jgi:hypothetical protein
MARVAAAATESLLRDNILMTAPGSTTFAPAALDAMRVFVVENGFKVVLDPAQPRDTAWDACLRVPPAARADFFARYPYDVAPASDDQAD